MTPEQKVKHLVLIRRAEFLGEPEPEGVTTENINDMYEDAKEADGGELQDAKSEVRGGEVETDITGPYSRYYESKEVAAKAPDGSWVGWTYWYSSGKYGDPGAVDWMDKAYLLDCTEEELVVVQTFKKTEVAA